MRGVVTETIVEAAALAWLKVAGRQIVYDPDMPAPQGGFVGSVPVLQSVSCRSPCIKDNIQQ